MKVDLHIHSNFSDSSRSVEEIVKIAKDRNVSVLSICDHATIEAYKYLPQICDENDLNYILGVELGVNFHNENVHVLAYNFDKDNERIKALIEEQHKDFECEYIVYNMSKDFPNMSLAEYRNFEYPKEKGGWKYLYYAVAKGAAKDYNEANLTIFSKYSKRNQFSSEECSLVEFCEIVKQAGGISILAHPGYLYERAPNNFLAMLIEMKDCGINGVECYYPSHSNEVIKICTDFCKENNLRITVGCDCHGEFDKSEGFTIGALDIPINKLNLNGIL